jgi:hypothetical protein
LHASLSRAGILKPTVSVGGSSIRTFTSTIHCEVVKFLRLLCPILATIPPRAQNAPKPSCWVVDERSTPCHRAIFPTVQPNENPVVLLLGRASDPLVNRGRHFGRTVRGMCNAQALMTNGILRMGGDTEEELLTAK